MSWVSIIANVLSLISLIATMVRDNQQRGLGRMEAVNEALVNAHRDIAAGDAAEEQARAAHNKNPESDDAFDQDFRRRDQ